MTVLKWLILAVLSGLLGFFVCTFLTVHPLQMSRFAFAAAVTVCVLVAAFAILFGRTELFVGIPVSLVLILAGYTRTAWRVLSREDARPVPKLARVPGDPGLGHTAVVYFTHGEPELYDPIGWINQFREFDEQEIRFVPFLVRPLFLFQLRRHYLLVGKSEHRSMHMRMLEKLEEAFRAEGDDTTQFYISFLDDNPRPDAAVIQALNEGASRIIVSEVFLTISNHTAEGKHLIEALNVDDYVPTPSGRQRQSKRSDSGRTCSSCWLRMATDRSTSAWPGWSSRIPSPKTRSRSFLRMVQKRCSIFLRPLALMQYTASTTSLPLFTRLGSRKGTRWSTWALGTTTRLSFGRSRKR